jgi:transposase
MGPKRTDEFRKDAVRIALTSGLTRKQVADDLGVGMSTLNKWITAHRTAPTVGRLQTTIGEILRWC